jgi:histidinol-phosphatase
MRLILIDSLAVCYDATMKIDPLREYLKFASQTAYLAGRVTLGYYQTSLNVELKADGSPVTAADRQAEEFIRKRIEATYPDHDILGEEMGESSRGKNHRWIIDPIDGTKSFIRGVPLYATLIGLEIDGKVEVGAAYFPALDELVSAATGQGCWWNGRPASVSQIPQLDQAIIASTTTMKFEHYHRQEAWERLVKSCYFQAGWGDAYGYILVATGRIEVMLDPVMSAWDAAPFIPILEEAGGYFGDWQGNRTIYAEEGLATNQALLENVLAVINK